MEVTESRTAQFAANQAFGRALARFFDKMCCINLDRRPDRWRYVVDHFAAFGLDHVERVAGVDVRNDPALQAHERLLHDNYSLLAMCGCMLSHRKVVEAAKQAGLRNVLVFEDDVKILEDSIGSIDYSLSELAERDWDVFYLGATYLFRLEVVGSHLINTPNGAFATHAIAYNGSIFDRLLELLPADPMQYVRSDRLDVNAVDTWLQSDLFDHGKFFGTNPIMVVQGLQESDIAFNQQKGIEQKQIELFRAKLGWRP